MGNLLQLFVRFGGFVTFVLVEALCFFVIVQYNDRQDAIFSHSWGILSGNVLEERQEWTDYFGLSERVDSLMKENAALQSQVANARTFQMPYRDTQFLVLRDTLRKVDGSDSVVHKTTRPLYEFIAAKVVGNSRMNSGYSKIVRYEPANPTCLNSSTCTATMPRTRHRLGKMVLTFIGRAVSIGCCPSQWRKRFSPQTRPVSTTYPG